MNEIMKDLSAIAMAVVGVALLTVIVSKNNQTPAVIGAATSGFSGMLATAMGGTAPASMGMANG